MHHPRLGCIYGGADRGDGLGLKEGGIVEEIELENLYRNPLANFTIWDSVLYGIAKREANLKILFNCSCVDANMNGDTIASVKGWQGTAETWHTVSAKIFADCSGDSILAPLTGANVRIGRESRAEFGESIQPEQKDKKTMGMSCLLQIQEHNTPVKFIPPDFAWDLNKREDIDINNRPHTIDSAHNFRWLELGGENDSIHDTESLRDELVGLGMGLWNHMKNQGEHGAQSYSLKWMGFLPVKRESRRYIGDYTLTQNDVAAGGKFIDVVAYGGWSMDDHHPAGMRYAGEPTIFHHAPQPYGIPYRCLYSENIANLYVAGRNISATHAAMSSSRVMGTCAVIGQAVGTAASLAIANELLPREIKDGLINELQSTLMHDDCYLPFSKKEIAPITLLAKITTDSEDYAKLMDGVERDIEAKHSYNGSVITYAWDEEIKPSEIRLIFDSDLKRTGKNMPHRWLIEPYNFTPPDALAKDFDIEILKGGKWTCIHEIRDNHKRLVKLPLDREFIGIRLKLLSNWAGDEKVNVFSFEVR